METTYSYDSQGIKINEGTVEINCPADLEENETQFDHDGFGRLISAITKNCN
ncbi:MAG: hypothetical protein R2824_30080 [Saprospiraceae bacterium]